MLKTVCSICLVALFAQRADVVQSLEHDRRAVEQYRPADYLIELQALHLDGSPARGTIACSGYWRKFDEREESGPNLPFATDARGVIILNPWLGTFDDTRMDCTADDAHGHHGVGSFDDGATRGVIYVR